MFICSQLTGAGHVTESLSTHCHVAQVTQVLLNTPHLSALHGSQQRHLQGTLGQRLTAWQPAGRCLELRQRRAGPVMDTYEVLVSH